ncbi:MAG: hypothetical protein COA58_07245 [Bacteroidetes bacterium]|nr:MAG: hypothetical protein COA58_07245 [Bacteroidota bacterium]
MSPFGWIKAKKDTKEFDEYLVTLGNKNFFCYNNRVKGFECINNEIIPNLHEDVEPIFLIGKSIENTSYDTGYLSNIFRHFKNYNRFPHLVKIRNGEIFDTSLNSEFFSYLDTGKNKKRIDRKIEQFFEFKEIGK